MRDFNARGVMLCLLATSAAAPAAVADETEMLELGRRVFTGTAQPPCGLCHTLADAGTTGEVGPILDVLRPDADRVRNAVVNGIGPMHPNEVLTEEEVEAVALYVSSVAGKSD